MTETSQPRPPAIGAAGREIDATVPTLCPEMPDLAPGFALNALDRAETEAVKRHIALCEDCAGLVDDALRTAAMLPYFIKPVAPPPDVRAALFSRISHADQARSVVTATPSAAAALGATSTLPASRLDPSQARAAWTARRRLPIPAIDALVRRDRGQAPTAGLSERDPSPARRAWGNWPGPLIPIMTPTVPLLLVLAVVGGWAMTQYNRANEMATYQDLWGTMGNVFSADDGTYFNLEPTRAVPASVTGQVIAELDAEQALLMAWGLPTNSSVSYGVWVERDGRFIPAGELDVDERGNARTMIELAGRLRECQRVIVTATAVDANGRVTSVDVLAASITPAGPASGGDGTEGDQSVGSESLGAVQMAARNK